MKRAPDESPIEITDLYPNLSDTEAQEAEENLTRYLELAFRIYERVRNDPESYQQLKSLTSTQDGLSMHDDKVESNQVHFK